MLTVIHLCGLGSSARDLFPKDHEAALREFCADVSGVYESHGGNAARLLTILRLMRNMCAGNEGICQQMIMSRAHVTAAQLVTAKAPDTQQVKPPHPLFGRPSDDMLQA